MQMSELFFLGVSPWYEVSSGKTRVEDFLCLVISKDQTEEKSLLYSTPPHTHATAEDDTVSVLSSKWPINARILHPLLLLLWPISRRYLSLDTGFTSAMNHLYVCSVPYREVSNRGSKTQIFHFTFFLFQIHEKISAKRWMIDKVRVPVTLGSSGMTTSVWCLPNHSVLR